MADDTITHVAVLTRWGDQFYFVSDDGEHWYEVSTQPRDAADVDHLRPFSGDGRTSRLNYARRWLVRAAQPPDGGGVKFTTVD